MMSNESGILRLANETHVRSSGSFDIGGGGSGYPLGDMPSLAQAKARAHRPNSDGYIHGGTSGGQNRYALFSSQRVAVIPTLEECHDIA
jgi:hypothetical protein